MDSILLVFLCLALGAAAILCGVIATVVLRIGKNLHRVTLVVEAVQKDVNILMLGSLPLIEKTSLVLDQTKHTLNHLDTNLAKLSEGLDNVSGITHDVRMLEQSLLARVRPSLEDLASLVSGVARGVTVFVKRLQK